MIISLFCAVRIRPICIPIDEPVRSRCFVDYTPFIAGWGHLQDGGKTSDVLYEKQVPVLDNAKCKERYRKLGKLFSENQFDESVMCAGILNGSRGDCQSDSGGPLMQPVRVDDVDDFRYYQTGVGSYGFGCAQSDTPTVYTRIQHFVNWIEETIKQ